MQSSMAIHGFAPAIAQIAQPTPLERLIGGDARALAEARPSAAAAGDGAAAAAGSTARAVAQIQLASRAEKEALLDRREAEAREEATKPVGEKILEEGQAGPAAMAKAAGGEAGGPRRISDLAPGVETGSPADVLRASISEASERYEARLAATRAYETLRLATERQAELQAERRSQINLFV